MKKKAIASQRIAKGTLDGVLGQVMVPISEVEKLLNVVAEKNYRRGFLDGHEHCSNVLAKYPAKEVTAYEHHLIFWARGRTLGEAVKPPMIEAVIGKAPRKKTVKEE